MTIMMMMMMMNPEHKFQLRNFPQTKSIMRASHFAPRRVSVCFFWYLQKSNHCNEKSLDVFFVFTGSIDPGFVPRSYDANADDGNSSIIDFDLLSTLDEDEEPRAKCPFIMSEAEESLESEDSVVEEEYI